MLPKQQSGILREIDLYDLLDYKDGALHQDSFLSKRDLIRIAQRFLEQYLTMDDRPGKTLKQWKLRIIAQDFLRWRGKWFWPAISGENSTLMLCYPTDTPMLIELLMQVFCLQHHSEGAGSGNTKTDGSSWCQLPNDPGTYIGSKSQGSDIFSHCEEKICEIDDTPAPFNKGTSIENTGSTRIFCETLSRKRDTLMRPMPGATLDEGKPHINDLASLKTLKNRSAAASENVLGKRSSANSSKVPKTPKRRRVSFQTVKEQNASSTSTTNEDKPDDYGPRLRLSNRVPKPRQRDKDMVPTDKLPSFVFEEGESVTPSPPMPKKGKDSAKTKSPSIRTSMNPKDTPGPRSILPQGQAVSTPSKGNRSRADVAPTLLLTPSTEASFVDISQQTSLAEATTARPTTSVPQAEQALIEKERSDLAESPEMNTERGGSHDLLDWVMSPAQDLCKSKNQGNELPNSYAREHALVSGPGLLTSAPNLSHPDRDNLTDEGSTKWAKKAPAEQKATIQAQPMVPFPLEFFFISSRTPLLEYQRWKDGRLSGADLESYMRSASLFTRKSNIERLKCTLQTSDVSATEMVERGRDDEFQSMVESYMEVIETSWAENRNKNQKFKIWIEPMSS